MKYIAVPIRLSLALMLGLPGVPSLLSTAAAASVTTLETPVPAIEAETVLSAEPAYPEHWQGMRDQYQRARQAIQEGKEALYNPLLENLKGYPLLPYLHYERLRRQLDTLDRDRLEQFRLNYGDTPLPPRLHRRWLDHLAQRKEWQALVDNFDPTLANTALHCQKLWAQHQLGEPMKALTQVADFWVIGSSQPNRCDPLFKAWMDAGLQTEDHAWERFWLALESNNSRLARYLVRFLDTEARKELAKTALTLHRYPQRLTSTQLPEDDQVYSRLVIHTLQRLARRDTPAAIQLLEQRAHALALSDEALSKLKRKLGMRLLRRYQPDSETWLEQIDPSYSDLELLEWRIRNQLNLSNWTRAGELLAHLPVSEALEGRWRYWQARVLGESGDEAQAQKIYQELSKERSFYGFMASHRIGGGYSLNDQPLVTDAEIQELLAANPALIRARELRYHGQWIEARREWYQATLNFDAEQHHQAAGLARRWGWYQQGIRSAIAAREWDDLQTRFPAPHSDKIASSAARFQIDTTWIFAVARQESAFMADARSHAGAVGLMQLMPATARQTARSLKLHYHGPHQLTDPDTNIQLGSAYLAKMLKRYGGNRVLATAAYNAGPARVSRWLNERGALPVDVWIETIPFDETRRYVQNVLSYAVIYGDILGYEQEFLKPLETALPPGPG